MAQDKGLPTTAAHTAALPKELPFTGWESDRFVRFAAGLISQGLAPYVRVVGREPITITDVEFTGQVIDTLWNGYRRYIVVETEDGVTYQVGGSNATRPIASAHVTFINLPPGFLGAPQSDDTLEMLLGGLRDHVEEASLIAQQLKVGIRLDHFSSTSKTEIIRQLSEFVLSSDRDLKREIVEVLGLIETPEVLQPLLTLLKDADESIRIDAALRFRGMEPVIKSIGEDSELGAQCIKALAEALDDPVDEVRIYSAEDLGYVYNEKAIRRLVRSLEEDPADDVRWAAAIALGRTNDPDVPKYLLKALDHDLLLQVKQAALLGLGRRGDVTLARLPGFIDELVPRLTQLLTEGDERVRDYAAFTAGALGPRASDCVPALVRNLRPTVTVEIKSNAALSLSKLADALYTSIELVTEVEHYLQENLAIPRSQGYPASAFYNWFLEYGAELATHLELHELASQYYAKASEAFSAIPWRSRYYAGISKYEFVEYFSSNARPLEALTSVQEALELFEEVYALDAVLAQSEKVRQGIEFRLTMARGRRHMLAAAIEWWQALTEDDFRRVSEQFEAANRQYTLIDVADVASTGKRLTPAEQNLLASFRTLAVLGVEVVKLQIDAGTQPDQAKGVQLARVTSLIQQLRTYSIRTRSKALSRTTQTFTRLSEANKRRLRRLAPEDVSTQLFEFVRSIRDVYYSLSLAMPGIDCPVISFGRASLSVRLPGNLGGDGSQEHPYAFPSGLRLVFEPVVYVQKRTKNDRLVFRDLTAPHGRKPTVEEVPVHESSYNVPSIDYGRQSPTAAAIHFDFGLDFQNAGCSQPADPNSRVHRVFVRIVDAPRDGPSERTRKDVAALHTRHKQLLEQLSQLEAVLSRSARSGHTAVQRDIRRVRRKLAEVENSIRHAEET